MEPVSILGVAGNAIQFIDFAAKLISKTHAIHRRGSLVEHNDLQITGNHLANLSTKLKSDLEASSLALTENDRVLHDMCTRCLEIADELGMAVAKLKGNGAASRRCSFRQALKAMWGSERLKDIQERLNMFSQQLNLRMQAQTQELVVEFRLETYRDLREAAEHAAYQHATVRSDMQRLREEAEQQAEQLRTEIRHIKQDLERSVKDIKDRPRHTSGSEQKRLQELAKAMHYLWAAKELMLQNMLEKIAALCEPSQYSLALQSSEPLRVQPYPSARGTDLCVSKLKTPASTRTDLDIADVTCPSTASSPREVQLWYPIAARNVTMLKTCLEKGADVNAMYTPDMDAERASPLLRMPPLVAAFAQEKREHRAEIVRLLLAHGADPFATDNGGTSTYKYAVLSRDTEATKVLVLAMSEASKNDQQRPQALRLERTVSVRNATTLRWELALAIIDHRHHEIPPLLADSSQSTSILKTACLHLATIFENEEAVVALLDHGISAINRHSFPATPLGLALRQQNARIIQRMLEWCGSNPHARSQHWYNHIFLNASGAYTNHEIIELILDHVPIVESLEFAVNDQNRTWIHRISMRALSHLLQHPYKTFPGFSDGDREAFWKLLEKAFDECTYRKWAFDMDIQRDVHYIEGLSASFAEKLVKWIEEQTLASTVIPGLANMRYVLKAHVARERMRERR